MGVCQVIETKASMMNVVSRKLVKPCTPTPPHLKSYNISFLDQLIPPLNMGVILFYSSKPTTIATLEESLSKTLVQFYPLAGRYVQSRRAVDCSDQGVEFILAELADVELRDLLSERDAHKLTQHLLPLPSHRLDPSAPLASIQLTEFSHGGGGLAVGVNVSHQILDTHALSTFISAWAHQHVNLGNPINPDFNFPLLFPCRDDVEEEDMEHDPDVVAKRFVFDKDAITALRSELISRGSRPISRVRAVSAFIAMALIRADTAKHGRARACVITQPVSMRGRTIPPLPQQSCGNLAFVSSTRCIGAAEMDSVGIQDIVDEIGDATEKSVAECGEMFFPGRDRYKIVNDPMADFLGKTQGGEVNVLWLSDCTKFGFYDADLGWGKPELAVFAPLEAEKMTVLLGNKEGDGIEAWLHLKRDDMAVMEQDEEMKMFAA